MNLDSAKELMRLGAKMRRTTWGPGRFVIDANDSFLPEDEAALDWVETTDSELQETPTTEVLLPFPPAKPLEAPPLINTPPSPTENKMQIKKNAIDKIKVKGLVDGKETPIEHIVSVESSNPAAALPILSTDNKLAMVKGLDVAQGITLNVAGIVTVEGQAVAVTGVSNAFDVVDDELIVPGFDEAGNPLLDENGQQKQVSSKPGLSVSVPQ